jgi:hypothetical protein
VLYENRFVNQCSSKASIFDFIFEYIYQNQFHEIESRNREHMEEENISELFFSLSFTKNKKGDY